MNEMSKTHWVAAAYIVAQALEAGGLIPPGMVSAVSTIFTGLLTLTVGHRAVKATGLVQPKP